MPANSLPIVHLFTDGACSGNPGPGGWAFILRHPASGKELEKSGGEQLTTNNRMELTAAVEGLATLKSRSQIELFTDSVYVGKGISEWLPKWKANGWRRKEKNKLVPIANEELWRKLDALLAKHEVNYTRVAGHSGHPENDRVDELAVAAYQRYLQACIPSLDPLHFVDFRLPVVIFAGFYNTLMSAVSRQSSVAELLATPVEFVRGVGPQRAALLEKLHVRTAGELLFFFPRDYQDLTDRREIADLDETRVQTVRGEVVEIDARSSGFGKSVVGVLVRSGNDYLRALWFNQPYMREKFHEGEHLLLSGKPRLAGNRWEMPHPRVILLDGEEDQPQLGLLPLYPLTEGLSQFEVRRMVEHAQEKFGGVLEEVFPDELLAKYELMPISEALPAIHAPADATVLERARRRFVFQELFILQLAVVARRHQQRVGFRAPPLAATADINARIERLFPFEWTAAQRAAVREVAADLAGETPMNRLLQGDVGSGKTVVAVYAMLVCVACGHQAALMAPTEILARQHAETLVGLLRASRVRHVLLTGGLSAAERQAALAEIAAGRIDLVIGTHAILHDDVKFVKLGLVVIDEQHKFGVRQRAALRQGERAPHYLVMTATPIPRTISMTLFGDLDVTTIREMPPGRQEVRTYLVDPAKQERWWKFVREKLRAGRQAYFVTPLVDESENVQAASVSAAFERLTNAELAEFRVGLIHGRLTPKEKEQAMADFRAGKMQVLVSTSVIEVGVDVPNASLMIIDSAERFGLAQLHQLRGRVGRGRYAGFCGVLIGEELSEQATSRLESFAATTDGFALAEMDFELRGPGDLFGTQQHGLPPLRIADLRRDQELLKDAREQALLLFGTDPGLAQPEHARLRRQMLVRYGAALDLADVG